MKKLLGITLITVGLLAGAPAIGSADSGTRSVAAQNQTRGKAHANKWRRWHHEKGLPATAVPELDPGAAGQALALLLAATALLIDRRRIVRA
jgi:hypothetical protein